MTERAQFDFESILALSPNPYVVMDANLVIVWMNEAYLAATMSRREDIIGKSMFDAFPSEPGTESYDLLNDSLHRVLDSGQTDELALIRYDIMGPEGKPDVRYWSATHTPLCKDGKVKLILQHTVDVTELHQLRNARDGMGVIRRASAVQQQNRTLTRETHRLMDLFEQAPGFTAILAGPDHRFEMVNEAYRELVGREDLLGRKVEEALPEIAAQGFIGVLDRVFASGEAYFGHREQILLHPEGDRPAETRFLNFIFQPIYDDSDIVTGIIVQGYDVTDEVEAQERQDLLVNELNHRVKNSLAIVQGLAMQSFRGDEAQEARSVFEARLRTLAGTHNLLTEGTWGAADVSEIVIQSVEAALGENASRVRTAGPPVHLSPQSAVALAMVVHELCTNALKYGALSNDNGMVDIAWTRNEGNRPMLRLEWKESGGPKVIEPERTGFGTRLISRGISYRAGGSAELSYEQDGIRYVLEKSLEAA